MVKSEHLIKHFHQVDAKIAPIIEVINFTEWFEVVTPANYFGKLCREIIGQQLAGKAAKAIHGRFLQLMDQNLVTPKQIIEIPDQSLREVGLSWAKVKYIKDLANQTLNHTVELESLEKMDDEAVITELTKVKGIGRWTAEMFLIFSLGRENVFSYGDLGLRKGLEKIYGINKDELKKIEVIVEAWSPYKSYGSIALWHGLDNQ
jgi:DNA-3-methyladenine glycosylase II